MSKWSCFAVPNRNKNNECITKAFEFDREPFLHKEMIIFIKENIIQMNHDLRLNKMAFLFYSYNFVEQERKRFRKILKLYINIFKHNASIKNVI